LHETRQADVHDSMSRTAFTRCAGTELCKCMFGYRSNYNYYTVRFLSGNAARAMEKSLNYTRKPHTAVHVR
jgi:hypothetical protein